ncbi:MAG: type II toxin-antitoxin system RatA family toxin [Planctomycetes bacterium]|jgi:ribosome-associated toxin RatA of RatAB toxin-antitoxin module|nr:type II toxin-antitoxin system RatA family toxin [Planctomycetota bacterium]
MRKVNRSALVPYSAAQMFALVKDVEAYPAFLPWCHDAEVHIRERDFIEASLELRRGKISKRFRTRNQLRENEFLGIELVGGPFRHMSGGWTFQPLGESGCKVGLSLEFEFENRATDVIFGRFFEHTCNTLVDSFTRQAARIYAG